MTVSHSRLLSKQSSTPASQVRDIQAYYEDDEEFLNIATIQNDKQSTSTKATTMMLNGCDKEQPITCKLDTGAEANVTSCVVYDPLGFKSSPRACKTKLHGFQYQRCTIMWRGNY